jgi:hypothetical protein
MRLPLRSTVELGREETEAAFKMSFARRSSRTSRSSWAIRSLSAVEVPCRRPASISACFNQPRNDSVPIPSSLATRVTTPKPWPPCASINPCAMRTARSRSSGGYRLCDRCCPMLHPHFQGTEPPGIPGRFKLAGAGDAGQRVPCDRTTGARSANMARRAWGRDRVVTVVTAQCRCVSVALVNPLRRRGAMLGERP